MTPLEVLRIALSSLLVNRLRALLTTLGIIIGVGAVIGLISLGRGVQAFIASEFADLGSNLLVVFSSSPTSPTRERIEPITTIEAADLANIPGIVAIAPIHGLSGNLIYGRESVEDATSFGVTPSYVQVRNYTPLLGRWITTQDIEDRSRVIVLGYGIAEDIFGEGVNPVGEFIRYRDIPFEVVGVMEETSAVAGENQNIYIPISTSQQRLAPPERSRTRDGGYFLDAIYLQGASEDILDELTLEIELYLSEAHSIQFDGEQDFTVVSQAEILDQLNSITSRLTVFLSLIASTALLVGGIGIMNIMLVSVTERTREIGIRKALGAQQTDILGQFLIESVLLSLLGGALGIGLGWLIATLGTTLVNQLTLTVEMDSVLLATIVSAMVGIFFGIYPAWQASRKRPIDALRFE